MAQLGQYNPNAHADDFTDGDKNRTKNWLFEFGKNKTYVLRVLPPWDPNETNIQVPVRIHYGLVDKNDKYRTVQCPGRDTCEACKYDSAHKNDPTYKATQSVFRPRERHWMNVAVLRDIPNPQFPNIATTLPGRIWIYNCPKTVWSDLRSFMTIGTPTDMNQGANFLIQRIDDNQTKYKVHGYADRDPATGGNIPTALPPEFQQIISAYPVIEDVNNDYGQTGSGIYNLQKALPPADAAFIAEALRRSLDKAVASLAPGTVPAYASTGVVVGPPPMAPGMAYGPPRPPVTVPPPAPAMPPRMAYAPPPPISAPPAPAPVASATSGPVYQPGVPPPRGGVVLPPPPPPPGVRMPPPPAPGAFATFDDFSKKGPDAV